MHLAKPPKSLVTAPHNSPKLSRSAPETLPVTWGLWPFACCVAVSRSGVRNVTRVSENLSMEFSWFWHVLAASQTPFPPSPLSMDGFRLVKLNEVIRQVDIVITCTGTRSPRRTSGHQGCTPCARAPLFPQRWGGDHGCSLRGLMAGRQQERGDQGTPGSHEEQLHRLQHGALQHRDRRGERGNGAGWGRRYFRHPSAAAASPRRFGKRSGGDQIVHCSPRAGSRAAVI